MTVRVEKDGAVWTVIHSRPEARNAMDPPSLVAWNWRFGLTSGLWKKLRSWASTAAAGAFP